MAWSPLDAMKATVYKFRGEICKEMEQGVSTSYGLINMDDATKNGACKAFSYYWMYCHKNHQNFWNFILTPSGILKVRNAQADENKSGTSFDKDWVKPNEVLTGLGFSAV